MINVLKTEYWSRADAFLLPLTGIDRDDRFNPRSYLFWNEYSIEDYKMMLTFSCEEYEDLLYYCRKHIFPVLDGKGYLIENYDVKDRSVFVLDISEWAMDVQMFLSGKYSKMSKEAKAQIERYHIFGGNKIPIHVYAVLHPNTEMAYLGNKSPIQYISENYKIDIEDLKTIGEIGSIYDREKETLTIDEMCHEDEEISI